MSQKNFTEVHPIKESVPTHNEEKPSVSDIYSSNDSTQCVSTHDEVVSEKVIFHSEISVSDYSSNDSTKGVSTHNEVKPSVIDIYSSN